MIPRLRGFGWALRLGLSLGAACVPLSSSTSDSSDSSDSSTVSGTCANTKVDVATTNCRIASGAYTVVVSPRCPNNCGVRTRSYGPVNLKVSGTIVSWFFQGTASDGSSISEQFQCTLTGCACSDGDIKGAFDQTGFSFDSTTVGTDDAGAACSQPIHVDVR